MSRIATGFGLIDIVILAAIIGVVWLVAPIAKNKFNVISANNSCMEEVEAYAIFAMKALGSRKVPAPPINRACTGTTDVSRGATLDTDITTRARPPGTARFTCDLNVRARCIEP